jgi:hypothetical protein
VTVLLSITVCPRLDGEGFPEEACIALERLPDRARTRLTGFLPVPPCLSHKEYAIAAGSRAEPPASGKAGSKRLISEPLFAPIQTTKHVNLQALRETGATGLEPAMATLWPLTVSHRSPEGPDVAETHWGPITRTDHAAKTG